VHADVRQHKAELVVRYARLVTDGLLGHRQIAAVQVVPGVADDQAPYYHQPPPVESAQQMLQEGRLVLGRESSDLVSQPLHVLLGVHAWLVPVVHRASDGRLDCHDGRVDLGAAVTVARVAGQRQLGFGAIEAARGADAGA